MPGDGLLRPLPLAAILLLVLNDHVWKAAHPSALTGKLSDLAGLAFFPLLLVAGVELATRRVHGRATLLAAVAATGLVFVLVKTTAPGAAAYRFGLALLQWPVHALPALARGLELPPVRPVALVQDPTDLLALPALALAAWAGWRRQYEPSTATDRS